MGSWPDWQTLRYTVELCSAPKINPEGRFSKIAWTHLLFDALLFSRCNVVTPVLSDRTQHTDAHLVGAAEQLQALLMLRADLPVQVTRLIHQLVSFEGGGLVVRLDVGLAVVGEAHQARLDGLAAPANAEVAEGLAVHVGEGRELRKMAPGLVVYVGQVAPQHGPRSEAGTALRAVVHPHVVKLVPVDLDALQAVGVTAGDGDGVSYSVRTQETEGIWWQWETRLSHDDRKTTNKDSKDSPEFPRCFKQFACSFGGEIPVLVLGPETTPLAAAL